MQPDSTDLTNSLLIEIAQSLRNETLSSSISGDPFHAPVSVLWVNGLWFASLTSSLAAAFFALLARQWLQEYKLWMTHQLDDDHFRARLRHFRHVGIESWWMSPILRGLPLVLHAALLLFAVGLIIYIARSDQRVAIISGVLVAVILVLYMATLLLPFFFAQCPYQTLPIKSLQRLLFRVRCWMLRVLGLLPRPYAPVDIKNRIKNTRIDVETSDIRELKHVLDAQILVSLISSPGHELDKVIIEMIGRILPKSETRVGDVLRKFKVGELVANRYKELLTLHDKPPFTRVDLGPEGVRDEVYHCLQAIHFLSVYDAMPSGWASESGRIQMSLYWLKDSGVIRQDCNMRSIVLTLISHMRNIRYADMICAYGCLSCFLSGLRQMYQECKLEPLRPYQWSWAT